MRQRSAYEGSSSSPHPRCRSLSVGTRRSSRRQSSTRRSPIARTAPVAGSTSRSASVRGRRGAGCRSTSGAAAARSPATLRETTRPAGAQGVSPADTASTTTTTPVPAAAATAGSGRATTTSPRGGTGGTAIGPPCEHTAGVLSPPAIGEIASVHVVEPRAHAQPVAVDAQDDGAKTAARSASCARGVRSAATSPSMTSFAVVHALAEVAAVARDRAPSRRHGCRAPATPR